MVRISKLQMDYTYKHTGIDHMPSFSWAIASDQRDVKQLAYRLQLATDKNFETLLYDRVVETSQSNNIKIANVKLESLSEYYVRVRCRTNRGISDWSSTGYFLTSLLDHKEWKAQFISAESDKDKETSKTTYVKKVFGLKKQIRSAYVCSTSLGIYHLFLNGRKVGRDELAPGWTSYHKNLLYQTYDVTDYLNIGNNEIYAWLAPGWYKGRFGLNENQRHNYGDKTAFLCQLTIIYDDGSIDVLVSDESWVGADAPIVFAEIYDGEIYDASKEIISVNDGTDDALWKPVSIISYDLTVLSAQSSTKIQVIDEIEPKRIFKTPKGEVVIDFGQNLTGWIEFRASGKYGDKAVLECFEVLDQSGNAYFDNLRGAQQRIEYRFAKDGQVVYRPRFTYQGFQYARLTDWPSEPQLSDFKACVVYSNMQRTGDFSCSHQGINQLHHNVLWGMKSNYLDIPTDCPQRNERMGWTGDAQIFVRTAAYLMNIDPFMRKWLKDLEAEQLPGGGVPFIIPDILTGQIDGEVDPNWHSAAGWSDAAVIVPWTIYLMYGDEELLANQFASMKSWIDFMVNNSNDYIWNYVHQYGDWVALDAEEGSYQGATPVELISTAYFAYSTKLLVKAAIVLGKTAVAINYQRLFVRIKDKFQREFFNSDGELIAQTQTAHILALYFELTPEEWIDKTAENLVHLLEKNDYHLNTGFIGTPYFTHALSENGYVDEAFDLLLQEDYPSWLYSVKQGATTIWEHWDGIKPDGSMWSPEMNSFNHYVYGAVADWIYRVVIGFEIDDRQPGFKHVILQPHVGGGLTFAKGRIDSIYGDLKMTWNLDNNVVKLAFDIPANTSATVVLTQAISIRDADGITFMKDKDGYVGEAGSGSYKVLFEI